MSRVSNGVREVEINGETYTLKATIAAIEAIEGRFQGSLVNAAQACMKLSFGDAVYIIQKAAGITSKDEVKALKNNILMGGVEAAASAAAEYIGLLINPDQSEPEEGEEEGEQ